jgi:hypothetical protein
MATRLGIGLVAAVAASLAGAQDWSVQSGATARVEYNDNYFFTSNATPSTSSGSTTPVAPQSAITGSITPFVTAARRTEASEVTALVAVGANKVWSISPNVDYLSGRFALDGAVRDARSTLTGDASFVRSASLQNASGLAGTTLVLAYTNAASIFGSYTYALTERWSLGATAGAYSNTYSSVDTATATALSNNHGYNANGNVGFAYSDRTQFAFTAAYSDYISNLTHADAVTTTIGIVHQFSPQLTISASVGGFWSDTKVVQSDVPAAGSRVRDDGPLYGGSVSYAFSERTQFGVNLSENLVPSGSGALSKNEVAGAWLTHQFSDRLTGRLGANYTRTIVPVTISSSATNNYYAGEAGISYLLAERWKLDAGYRYARARYEQIAGQAETGQPRSNVVFVTISYNWPGASSTNWVGQPPNVQGSPGAGAVPLPVRSQPFTPPPGTPAEGAPSETTPFDRFTIP